MVAHVDQKLGKINGIICDLCSKPLVDKFEYFSAKFDYVEVDRAVGKSGIVQHDKRALDLDVCKECMDEMKARVIDNIKKRDQHGVWDAKAPIQHTQSMDAKHPPQGPQGPRK